MSEDDRAPHYWERFSREGRVPPGEDLAAMRRGAGRAAGAVPALWRHYSVADAGGDRPGPALAAEHHALVLYGFHQQGQQSARAHVPGRRIADALREVRQRPRFRGREDALDGRVAAAATATSVDELAWHLRALVRFLRDEGVGFDYTLLWRDLLAWQVAGGPERVRRAWGLAYFAWGAVPATDDGSNTNEEPAQEATCA